MKRIYHPYWLWEDLEMWRRVCGADRAKALDLAVSFTGDAKEYGKAMLRVIDEFPLASEHNLTDTAQNRQAWVGHAACYLRHDLTEDVVREAWGQLTDEQRDAANAVADIAIATWKRRFYAAKDNYVHQQLDLAWLP